MSEFWKRKMRTYFRLYDFDKDGVIPKNQWMEMASRFAQSEKADKQKEEHLKAIFNNWWEQSVRHAPPDEKERLTAEAFVNSMEKQLGEPELKHYISDVIHAFFDLLDVNRDGYLQEDEHHNAFVDLGVPDTSFTKEAFRAIDANHDGKLSADEFINAANDFFFSQDENNPNNLYFGPLVD